MVWSQVDALGLRMLVCPARCGFLDSEVCLSHSMNGSAFKCMYLFDGCALSTDWI